jgi:hypothetical protein
VARLEREKSEMEKRMEENVQAFGEMEGMLE